MNSKDISIMRLANQQIIMSKCKTARDLLTWMGAMQAQNFPMVKWAIGIRLPNSTDREISEAINRGDIIRTHLLRPTWHFVSATDVFWMLELTALKVKASMKSRQQQLGLSGSILSKSDSIIEKALRGGKHLSRTDATG